MNKKGFTLIELLSVIVVLALILVIAMPRILNVIEGAEKETFRISGENLVKQAKDKYILESNNDNYKTYTIEGGAFVGEELPMSGKLPNSGVIEVDEEGNVYLEIRNEKYCAKKDFNSQQIIVTTDVENCRIVLPLTNDCFETANISETEIEIISYNNDCPVDVIIPSEISGKTVVGIGNFAFSYNPEPGPATYHFNSNNLLAYNNDIVVKNTTENYKEVVVVEYYPNYRIPIKSVIIPNTVKYIGYAAFSDNQLISVSIPSSVTSIGYAAFSNNQLISVSIPSSVTNIGEGAFNNNQLPDNQAFIYKRNSDGSEDKTTIVSYGGAQRDNVSIPNSATSIGDEAFSNNQLISVSIPSSVTSIGSFAFSYNQLTSVSIPSNLTSIEDYAFYRNRLTSVVIPSSVTSIGYAAFSNNQLTNIEIPSSVTSIGSFAFFDNQLTSVDIPSSVTSIGDYAFYLNQLTSVDIPSSVTLSSSSISPSFYTSYVTNNNKSGGIYTAPSQDGVWTKQ